MSQIQNLESEIEFSHAATRQGDGSILALASRILDSIYLWQTRINERREMASLDERMLRDAGTRREEVLRESGKPFWRA